MQEQSLKQKQLSQLLNVELNRVFLTLNLNIIEGKMVSIYDIKTTPDLLEARIYLSVYPNQNAPQILKKIQDNAWEIKKRLIPKIKNKLRRMPSLQFYLDASLEHMYKMAELFLSIEKTKPHEH